MSDVKGTQLVYFNSASKKGNVQYSELMVIFSTKQIGYNPVFIHFGK